jgi:hypothetical protein
MARTLAAGRMMEAAKDLARALVHRTIELVYSGASVGVMGVLANAVLAAGGQMIGIIPPSLVDKEVAHPRLPDLRVVPSMQGRKTFMAELSDGFIALPGTRHARRALRGVDVGPTGPPPEAVRPAERPWVRPPSDRLSGPCRRGAAAQSRVPRHGPRGGAARVAARPLGARPSAACGHLGGSNQHLSRGGRTPCWSGRGTCAAQLERSAQMQAIGMRAPALNRPDHSRRDHDPHTHL